jgi:hypothetical protein
VLVAVLVDVGFKLMFAGVEGRCRRQPAHGKPA